MQPRRCTTPEQAPVALGRWIASLHAYVGAGCEKPDDDQKESFILQIPAWKIQEPAPWGSAASLSVGRKPASRD